VTLAELVARAEALYYDLELGSVREWKSEDPQRKAIGYLPIYVPREIIHAAGMLPVSLQGASGQLEIIRGDAYFQSYICQIPRSTIELALSQRLDCLDGALFPSICDVIRNLSGMWKLLFPDKYSRYLDVPQNYDPAVGGRFYAEELGALREDLGRLGGRPIGDAALRASIAAFNDNRRAVEAVLALRREEPWRVPTVEAYLLIRAGGRLPVEEHTAFLHQYLELARTVDRPKRDHTRVLVIGSFCEQPPLGLIRTLEAAGCYIVWDDLLLGHRWPVGDVSTDGDPIQALATAFLESSPATAARYEPGQSRGRYLLEIVGQARAEGAIFAAPSFCDPALLEQPLLQGALDEGRVPWTALKYAENLGQFQVIREQAGTFADSVKLWSEP
jgi:benzoyl-CoA reductase subunit C